MTAPPMNGNGDLNPQEVPGNVPLPPAANTTEALNALIDGITVLAKNAAMDDNAAEAKDYMQAALFAAQAQAVLDPNKTQTGTPLDHEIKMKQLDQQHQVNQQASTHEHELQVAKQQATAQAQASTPGKGATNAKPAVSRGQGS